MLLAVIYKLSVRNSVHTHRNHRHIRGKNIYGSTKNLLHPKNMISTCLQILDIIITLLICTKINLAWEWIKTWKIHYMEESTLDVTTDVNLYDNCLWPEPILDMGNTGELPKEGARMWPKFNKLKNINIKNVFIKHQII